jgi:hypothetical protein
MYISQSHFKTVLLRCLLNFSFATIGMFYFSYHQLEQYSRLGFVQLKLTIPFEKNDNFISIFFPCRDVREYKSRVESYSREILRKEAQIKELQNRLENGEGSKSPKTFLLFNSEKYFIVVNSFVLICSVQLHVKKVSILGQRGFNFLKSF